MSESHSTNGAPVRAAAYYRMSTLRQEDSIDRQRSQVEPYAEKHDYQIVREYIDEGVAGDEIAKRKDFQRMLRDAQAGQFEAILCDDKDRFGRFDSIDLGEVVAPLRRKGVWVDTVAQGKIDWNSFAGRVTDAVLQEAKKLEQEAISRRVLSNQLLKASEGKDTGGLPLYGYRREPDPEFVSRLVPDGRKAEVVKLIFTLYDQGWTLFAIAEELYRRGVPSPRGKKRWNRPVIRRVLTNRRYTGDRTWGVHASGKCHRYGKGGVRPRARADKHQVVNPPEEWVVRPNSHEPLVSRELFERVQARLHGNRGRTTPHANGGSFVLSKLLVCGHCGSFMVGTTVCGRRVYLCGGYIAHGKSYCGRNSVLERVALGALIRQLQRSFLDPENLQSLRQETAALEAEQRSDDNLRRLRERVETLGRQIDQGNENLAVLPADLLAGVAAKVREFKKERDGLLAELRRAEEESPAEDLERRIAEAEGVLWRLQEALKDEDLPLLRQVLREMVSKVEFFWTRHDTDRTIRYRLERGVIYLRPSADSKELCPPARRSACSAGQRTAATRSPARR
jgi:DNA invertase Pin-like site-specific DNA recombinase